MSKSPVAKTTRSGFQALWPASLHAGHYLFAAVFLVRLVVLIRLAASPFFFPSGSDMQFYDDWAKRILHGQWTDHQAFYGLPLYPFLLAALYQMFGYSPFVPGLIQAGLEAGTSLLIYKIILRVLAPPGGRGDQRITVMALTAGAAWALFVPAQAYSTVLMPTAIAVFIFWLLVWELLRTEAPPSAFRCFGSGLIIGLAATGVATMLFLIPLFFAAIFIRHTRRPGPQIMAAALLIAGVIGGTAPCWLHNRFAAHDPVFLSAHGGINLWLGNNPEATGYPRFPGLHAGQTQLLRDSVEQAEAAAGHSLKRSEVSNYWSHKAREYVQTNFTAWLRLVARKIANFWNAFEYDDVGIIRTLAQHHVVFPGLHFGLVAVLGLAGLIVSWHSFRASRWITAAVGLQMVAIIPVFITERYRLPVVPGLLIGSVLGLGQLHQLLCRGAYRIAALPLTAIALAAFLVTLPRYDPSLWALEAYNSGRLALDLKDFRQAERELSRAYALVPTNAETNFALGNLRHTEGQVEAAKALYEAALRADPNHNGALTNLGIVALDQNRPAVALDYFRKCLGVEPRNPKAHYLLAKALLAAGDSAGATEALRRAVELDGERPEFSELRSQIEAARR